ncbi:hypothetical protein [Roseinatronobacter alkalisoli]|uniref:Mitochondrial inner membrane protein n=1 Tax=Roseinatronobacter alkalisoli TaxID=3028235 RepID=A0ABT5TB74_9RHOB|nr:hypothetical protein [Roseinatronobacter sp. HJB301]MDD7971432.1 hypothetical protein [Roseinatronobacter sp. HJB301]
MARNTTSKGTTPRSRKTKTDSDDSAPQATGTAQSPETQPKASMPEAGTQAARTPDDSADASSGADLPQDTTADTPPVTAESPFATAQTDAPEPAAATGELVAPAPDDTPRDTRASDDTPRSDDTPAPGDRPASPHDTAPVEPAPAAVHATPAPAATVSILPLLLGGVLAGAIGYGAHFLIASQGSGQADLAALQAELSALRQDMPDMPDLAPLQAELADLRSDMSALSGPGADADMLAALEGRIDALAGDSETRATVLRDLQDRIAADLAQMQAELADLRDLAENRMSTAEAAIDAALARSGLDSLRAALETGQPFGDALERIAQGGFDPAPVLRDNAATGIPTLEQLQDGFPDAARAAIRASLGDAPADSAAERVVNFLRAQTGARSTTPRDGDDPDAVLSRASVAVESGDLDTALSLIAQLPQAGRDALSDWQSDAEAHQAATAEVGELEQMVTEE